ncbi:MAG: beta-ketoacyl-[acyl-carrier-protein] synthase family protein, partial [Verrucomicrobiota bacterium]
FGLRGPSATVSASCASAALAIGMAAEQIVLGKAELMLAGGAEAPLVPAVLAPLEAAGILGSQEDPARACRPFDRTRNGLCPGEGAAFLVLESADSAARRGVRPLARLSGWGSALDAAGRTGVEESGEGLEEVVGQALAWAGWERESLDYVNTHGTGTRLNDAVEARALARFLGERSGVVPCSSTKPVTGHCLGATPALEALLCLGALRHQRVPPTANCLQPDPGCALDLVTGQARAATLRRVLSTAHGFWGYHGALLFSAVPTP